jgi:hypothetical protein
VIRLSAFENAASRANTIVISRQYHRCAANLAVLLRRDGL